MIVKRDKILVFFGYLSLISLLVPWINIGHLGIRLDYIIMVLVFPILCGRIPYLVKNYRLIRGVIFTAIAIFFSMLLSNLLGNVVFTNSLSISIPTEFMQIYIRVMSCILFFYLGANNHIDYNNFIKLCSTIFLIALVFGFLQIIRIPIVESLSTLYATTDNQLKALNNLSSRRIFGTIGNSLSWGGLCVFFFNYFFFLERRKLFKIGGVLLSILGVFFSGSKTAIVTLVAAFVLGMLFRSTISKYKLLKLFSALFLIAIASLGVWIGLSTYFPEQLEFLEYRFTKLDEGTSSSSTDGRGYQLLLLSMMFEADTWRLLFGIGKTMLFEVVGFVEVEFFYILGSYGALGVFLHYTLFYFFVRENFVGNSTFRIQRIFVINSIISYMIFSLGFYFFRELGAGLYFWIVCGYLVGNYKYLLK